MKRCMRCGQLKPRSEFHVQNKATDRLHSWCKDCMREYHRQWYKANPDKVRAHARKYRATHQDECRARGRAFYWAHREECIERAKKWRASQDETYFENKRKADRIRYLRKKAAS